MTPMSKNIAPIKDKEAEVITAGQIGRAADRFSERCRVNASSLPKDISQIVLEDEGDALAQEMFEAFRLRVERRSDLIIRHFKIDRSKTLEQMITALGRKEHIDKEVLSTMLFGGPDEGDLYFFPGKRFISVAELAGEFECRSLVPHYLAQLQVNIDDPAFADEHPNGMQWGKNSFATFDRWGGEREVRVGHRGRAWPGGWWFAGFRKKQVLRHRIINSP
jgi:hypothetical protein